MWAVDVLWSKIMTFRRRRRVENIREAGFNFQETRLRRFLFLSPSSLSFSLSYPASADSSCARRPGVSFDLARATTRLPPSLLLLLATAAAFIAHRYCCLNGGSPPVLGTCFTADTRLLLLLPGRYTARPLAPPFFARARRSFPSPRSPRCSLRDFS